MSIAPLNAGPQRSGATGTAPPAIVPVASLATPTPADKAPLPASPAPPRFADLLLVTGPVAFNMEIALRRTFAATPNPKLVVAVGDCRSEEHTSELQSH